MSNPLKDLPAIVKIIVGGVIFTPIFVFVVLKMYEGIEKFSGPTKVGEEAKQAFLFAAGFPTELFVIGIFITAVLLYYARKEGYSFR